MIEFGSLARFAAHMDRLASKVDYTTKRNAEQAGRRIETEAKRVLGTYDYKWPKLADATKQDRERKGFPADEPLLRTGALRKSIEHTVSRSGMGFFKGWEVEVGSNSPVAVWQELGTSRIPPRPFLMGAVRKLEKGLAEELGKSAFHALTQR